MTPAAEQHKHLALGVSPKEHHTQESTQARRRATAKRGLEKMFGKADCPSLVRSPFEFKLSTWPMISPKNMRGIDVPTLYAAAAPQRESTESCA